MTATLRDITQALESQWTSLHAWLEPLGNNLRGAATQPSTLPGWSVADLVAHLGRSMSGATIAQIAPPGTAALGLATYLGSYGHSKDIITEVTQELAQDSAHDRLGVVTALVEEAFTHLAGLGTDDDEVVTTRRVPLTLRDLAVSRLLELVVHADDLVRSLAPAVDATGPNNPMDRTAVAIVADELLGIVSTRNGAYLEVTNPLLWVRLAAGRQTYDVDQLALAIRPTYAADAVPDLGRMLPLL